MNQGDSQGVDDDVQEVGHRSAWERDVDGFDGLGLSVPWDHRYPRDELSGWRFELLCLDATKQTLLKALLHRMKQDVWCKASDI